MLIIRHLNKSYNGTESVLKDISYDFEDGKLYVIKGVSGCGKTTLLNCIGGLDTRFEGMIENDKPGIGYIFQQSLLIAGLSALENIRIVSPKESDERICSLAEKLGVHELLDRQPSRLSGGERQRFSVLRAVINDPSLILADEPTASLDDETSRKTAELIAGLKNDHRIIIVVTHENYFDDHADEILLLDYGELGGNHPITAKEEVKKRHTGKRKKDDKVREKGDVFLEVRYFLKRSGHKLTPFGMMSFTLVFLAIMLLSAVQKNLSYEMTREYNLKYPMDLVEIRKDLTGSFSPAELSEMDIYEYYHFRDGVVCAYGLLPEEYSVFKQEGMIEKGSFPREADEILVSPQAAATLGLSYELGQTVSFMGRVFRVSGFTGDIDIDEELLNCRRNEIYLRSDYEQNSVFIPYETISQMGEPSEPMYGVYEVVWHGFSESKQKQERLERLNGGNTEFGSYYIDIEKVGRRVKIYLYYLAGVAVVLMLGCSVFIGALLRSQLFWRRRELGYLQVFGVTKKRLMRMLGREYLIRLAAAFFYAAITYILLALGVLAFSGRLYLPGLLYPASLISTLALLYLCVVRFSLSRYLKTDIAALIH